MLDLEQTPLEDEVGFVCRSSWSVTGSVGHWGHIHKRKNRYEAEFTVKPVDGVWKITGMEILEETRVDPYARPKT